MSYLQNEATNYVHKYSLCKTLNRIFEMTVLPSIDTFCEANSNIIFTK